MSLLFRILYAAHAKGTHHKLALDGLMQMRGPDSALWQRMFLADAKLLLEGAKAPDKEFKDFKNHVLHVRDNNWGGAPEKATAWYGHLVTALSEQRWGEAAYCAGVLSHYYTDPLMPFHTAQSEAESAIHRACEWSISKAYGDIKRVAKEVCPRVRVDLPEHADGPGGNHDWVGQAVVDGATYSNMYYEKLIAHYDINAGAADPATGLDNVSRRFLAKLLCYAAAGFGELLTRAISEAGVAAPQVNLTLKTVMAGLSIPIHWVTKRMEDAEERALVRAMYDELQETGTVDKSLPEDDRIIRDLYIKEVVNAPVQSGRIVHRLNVVSPVTAGPVLPAPMEAVQPVVMAAPAPDLAEDEDDAGDDNQTYGFDISPDEDLDGDGIPDRLQPGTRAHEAFSGRQGDGATNGGAGVPPRDASWHDADVKRFSSHLFGASSDEAAGQGNDRSGASAQSYTHLYDSSSEPSSSEEKTRSSRPESRELSPGLLRVRDQQTALAERLEDAARPESVGSSSANDGATGRANARSGASDGIRFYLSIKDDVEDGPSIGPKTAKRLEAAGIHTVADLLSCDVEHVAEVVDTRHITPSVLVDWQDQARLCCTIPQLRGGPSQLLVGAGYRTAEAVAGEALDDLIAAVNDYAASNEGQRALRSSEPPAAEKIAQWHERAQMADATRVALVA